MPPASEPAPLTVLHALLARVGTPTPGSPALIVSAPGAGKTPLLVHIALDRLMAERCVLHVALGDGVAHVRAHYDDVLRAASGLQGADHATAAVAIERRRMVLSYAELEFDPGHLTKQIAMLAQVAQFTPELIVVDGMHATTWSTHGAALAGLAAGLGVPMWVAITSDDGLIPDGPPHGAVIALEPASGAMQLAVVSAGHHDVLPWVLDPTTLLLTTPEALAAPSRVVASACTLYSGGAGGAEEAFGAAAAARGVREVNFTFEGHRQSRVDGAVQLSLRELEAGDVSLVYVSRRLHRTYNQHGLIRKVLQTLWHMVSRAQQVFVIGVIQDDGTVVGGTGWSVELARMWSKDLWVYDQDQHGWYTWNGHAWTPGEPTITAAQICGTGTRYLDERGRQAIDALFARSFP